MSKDEIDSFLKRPLVARVATNRKDGYPHVSPLWYHWDGEYLYLILGHGERPRHHITNLRGNDKVTALIDRDVRPETKTLFAAQAVSIRGRAKLLTDEKTQVDIVTKLLERYGFGGAVQAVLEDGKPGMNRVIARIKPDKIIAWDFEKLSAAYGTKK
jgi:nitroimidazol reductase NimA-like FMN-containing flavoprotein (pyridoxamine 5'-phosphate oxidase superfamily)